MLLLSWFYTPEKLTYGLTSFQGAGQLVCPKRGGENYVDSSRNRGHWGKTCNRLVKGKWLAVLHRHEVARSNRHRSYIRRSGDTRTGQDGGLSELASGPYRR